MYLERAAVSSCLSRARCTAAGSGPVAIARRSPQRGSKRCGLGDLAGKGLPPLHRAGPVVAVQPELRVERLQGGQVRLYLLGKLAQVALPELAHAALLLVQPLLRRDKLRLEEFGGAGGLPLAGLQVLLDVEARPAYS